MANATPTPLACRRAVTKQKGQRTYGTDPEQTVRAALRGERPRVFRGRHAQGVAACIAADCARSEQDAAQAPATALGSGGRHYGLRSSFAPARYQLDRGVDA